MQDESKYRDRHLVRLTDDQLQHLHDLVDRADEDFHSQAAFGDYEADAVYDFDHGTNEVREALARPVDGMVLVFGDGCDQDTFYNVFQPLVDWNVTVNGVLIQVTRLIDGDEVGLYGILLDEDAEPVRHGYQNQGYVYKGFDWSELRTVVVH